MRQLFTFFAVLLLCAQPSLAEPKTYSLSGDDKAALARVETYLSGIHTLTAQFTQAAPSGDITTGKFYLVRPGKLRMEYNDPTPILMVLNDGAMTYYDKELDQVTHIPLDSTLITFLARDKVRFDDTVIITNMERSGGSLRITLVQSKRPKDGSLTIEFSDNPLIIRNIIVADSAGNSTTVALSGAKFDASIDAGLFIFKDPHPDRKAVKK